MATITLHAHNGETFSTTYVDASHILMMQETSHGCDDTVPLGTMTLVVTTFGHLYAEENVEAVRASMFAAAGQGIADRGALLNEVTHLIRTIIGHNGRQDTH